MGVLIFGKGGKIVGYGQKKTYAPDPKPTKKPKKGKKTPKEG